MNSTNQTSFTLETLSSWSINFSRFCMLNQAIGQVEGKQDLIDRASSLAKERLSNTRNIEDEVFIESLRDIHPAILSPYPKKHLTAPLSPHFISSLIKDLYAAKYSSCSISSLGFNGPTLITNYIRENGSSSKSWSNRVVIKWTFPMEFHSTKTFSFLSSVLQNPNYRVPTSCFLDLRNRNCIFIDGKKEPIPEDRANTLITTFSKIANSNCCIPADTDSIMISEKIDGANLRDFILNRYHLLSQKDQKESFFYQLGFLSGIDLVVGNFDRLFQAKKNLEGLVNGPLAPANIGNVIIKTPNTPSSNVSVYAIDNGIHVDPKDHAKYEIFIKDHAQKPHRASFLARNITSSIEASFKSKTSPFYHPLPPEEDDFDLSSTFIGMMLESNEANTLPPITPEQNIRQFFKDADAFGRKKIAEGILGSEAQLKQIDLSKLPSDSLPGKAALRRIQTFKESQV
jgi:hypothetical protein